MDQDASQELHRLSPGPSAPPSPRPEQSLLPHFIRAEANFLRLPLFALHTKGLKTLDGIECRGTISRDGQRHTFILRATRNTASLYPGPLARAAHLAFLSIATERGFPLENPVIWTWRDLCRRMQIPVSGTMVMKLKAAIRSTARLSIQTEHAIYAKADRTTMQEQELHLYDTVDFRGGKLPDGSIADQNRLWLSDWYLANLNALFTAPLDYHLWRSLDERTTIASRLYEFLLLNFYSGLTVLRINYDTLAQFLPVAPERYRSQAIQQLSPALDLLTSQGIISGVKWLRSKDAQLQLHLLRGARLSASEKEDAGMLPFSEEEFAGTFRVNELRNLKPDESALVKEFYKLWVGQENARPGTKELTLASELIAQYGVTKAKAFMPLAIEQMREKWPDAKSFGAIVKYLPDIASEYERQQHLAAKQKDEATQNNKEQEERASRAKDRSSLQALWESMPEVERQVIRQRVRLAQPRNIQTKVPGLFDRFCLQEVAKVKNTGIEPFVGGVNLEVRKCEPGSKKV